MKWFNTKGGDESDALLDFLRTEFDSIESRQSEVVAALIAHKAEVKDDISELKKDLQADLLTQYTSKLEHQSTCATMQRDNRDRFLLKDDIPNLKEAISAETCTLSKDKFASKEAITSLRRELYMAATAFAAAVSAVTWVVDR